VLSIEGIQKLVEQQECKGFGADPITSARRGECGEIT
jgi:hypothetical protein